MPAPQSNGRPRLVIRKAASGHSPPSLGGPSLGQNFDVPTHVALLRGINVGGRNRVAMADLRAVVTSLAHRDVATYIQS